MRPSRLVLFATVTLCGATAALADPSLPDAARSQLRVDDRLMQREQAVSQPVAPVRSGLRSQLRRQQRNAAAVVMPVSDGKPMIRGQGHNPRGSIRR